MQFICTTATAVDKMRAEAKARKKGRAAVLRNGVTGSRGSTGTRIGSTSPSVRRSGHGML